VHFTAASGVGQLLLFVGDGSISQNTYVLSVPELEMVQSLDIPGLAWADGPPDGLYVVATQNRALSSSNGSTGLTLVVLEPGPSGRWNVRRELELVAGHGVEAGRIAYSEALGGFFVPSPSTGHLFFVTAR
jgi:hypothetical protein